MCTRELKFTIPQGSCSGANLFIFYSGLIKKIPDKIVINGFTDDHSIWKYSKAGNKTSKLLKRNELETVFVHIKNWLDTMHLKLNSGKTE